MSATIAELNIVKNRCAASSMLRRIWLAEKWVSRLTRKKMGVPFCGLGGWQRSDGAVPE
jgi:hypothetical protein